MPSRKNDEFLGKVALVTGGTRGIGFAIAEALAQRGCDLAINFLSDHETATEAVEKLQHCGIRVIPLQAHIGQAESRADLWTGFDSAFDRCDFLIVNAATGVFREASRLTINSLRKVFAVNFEAMLELANEAVKRMPAGDQHFEAGERGRIIALSSLGAERVIANYGSIGASKAAMEAMLRQLACEWGPKGINCNTIRAGLVDTGVLNYVTGKDQIIQDTIQRTPNGRLVHPSDVADLVCFMLSRQSSMINGQTLMVDGGYGIQA
jgi:enoyl-[acyl-carrier protein] reductase III